MNAVDFSRQLHDIKVCFLTTLIIMCILARIGFATCDAFQKSTCQSLSFGGWSTKLSLQRKRSLITSCNNSLQKSVINSFDNIISFCFRPYIAALMWWLIFGLGLGWDSVNVTSTISSFSSALYPPCLFCLFGVWISWFVGAVWTFTFPQKSWCAFYTNDQTVCIRPRAAKLVCGNRHFFTSRRRRPTFETFRCCNKNLVQPRYLFRKFTNSPRQQVSCRFDSFLHRHTLRDLRYYMTPCGFWCCFKKGVKLHCSLIRLLASIYICQILWFASNWMILTSVRRFGLVLGNNHNKHPSKIHHSGFGRNLFVVSKPRSTHFGHHPRCSNSVHADQVEEKDRGPSCCSSIFTFYSKVGHNPLLGVRVGEASNPGPPADDFLDFGTFNPTQLLNKEDDIQQWGKGIYTSCETSVTSTAHQVISRKFRQAGWSTRWSKFVDPQQPRYSQIRGKAGGTAILSTFPIRPYVEPCPDVLSNTDRFCDGVVQVACNFNIYAAVMYGFPISNAYLDALQMNNDLFSPIAERALNFQGPATISGDFNCDLKDLVAWKTLQNAGWWDAAILDSQLHNRPPQPTCRESTRRSFILVNPIVASKIFECRTCDDYLFSSHPLLLAKMDFQSFLKPQIQWSLPKATDDLLFDLDIQEAQVRNDLEQWGDKITNAIKIKDANRVATLFSRLVQNSWVASHVDVEGRPAYTKPGYLGRDRIKLLQKKPVSIPINRKSREGSFEPLFGQTSIGLRQHSRQLRRLESLVSQTKARSRSDTIGAKTKCQDLWKSILNAKGFHKSFAWWVGHHSGWFVPQNCPHLEYIVELKDLFYRWHNDELHQYYLHRQRVRRVSVALDTLKGGRLAFQEIRDPSSAPLTFLTHTISGQVVKTRWRKDGLSSISLVANTNFDPDIPIHFQGQKSYITRQIGKRVDVNPPLKLRDSDMTITQYSATANPDQLHSSVAEAWGTHWNRDPPLSGADDDWFDIYPVLERLPDLPPKAFVPFSLEIWKTHCKGLNRKSSRGGCGFSVCEMQSFPPSIVMQLFRIFEACENGMPWPTDWVTAKVSMLSKCDTPKSPFDARPITVFGVLYRQWSRIRSREILKYMASFMPVELAASTKGISADAVAGLITHIAETAINNNDSNLRHRGRPDTVLQHST